jgi:hypothetical protein
MLTKANFIESEALQRGRNKLSTVNATVKGVM